LGPGRQPGDGLLDRGPRPAGPGPAPFPPAQGRGGGGGGPGAPGPDRRPGPVPMSDVLKGEQVVVGSQGIRVQPLDRGRSGEVFEFMSSQVSSEKPQGLIVRRVAGAMRATKERGERVLWVGGPAVVHTGAGPSVVR